MGDESQNTMNLDLNLGPIVHPSPDNDDSMNLEDWLHGPARRLTEAASHRARQRFRALYRPVPIPRETRAIALEFITGNGLQVGEGSVPNDEQQQQQLSEVSKSCDNGHKFLEDGGLRQKEEDEKGNNGDEGGFFDCNICLDMAKNPVVTCCGHLFCWPCLYRWLNIHSDAKECPVCKGEVTVKTVTPIYGRGSGNSNSCQIEEEDSGQPIPVRPQARRVESWRQAISRAAFTIPMEEMIRRLGSRFDLTRDLIQIQPEVLDGPTRESPERSSNSSSLLNRILTSRGLRREGTGATASGVSLEEGADLAGDGASRRFSSLLLRRSHSNRAATISNLTSALSTAERLVESYFRNNPVDAPATVLPTPADDRDSVSSIAAVIHSESQTVDTAVEIDSRVSVSTSSSRRRTEGSSRVSDMDSGDSRAPRRRRLN